MRLRLTDQALVAVTLARGHAAAGGRGAHVGDLVVGLASEPEGAAGRRLGGYASAVTTLADRVAAAPPRLPALEVALGWCAGEVGRRPAGTVDLLLAALEVGAGDLADLLERCGLPLGALAAGQRPAAAPLCSAGESDALAETYGLDPNAADAEPAAARAVARTRAVGGGALTLLAALAVEAASSPEAVPLDPDVLAGRMRALPDRGERGIGEGADGDWDRGVEPVVEAAWRIRDPRMPLRALDLLRSAALVGGRGPSKLLALGRSDGEGDP
jgi:hypothetical protein